MMAVIFKTKQMIIQIQARTKKDHARQDRKRMPSCVATCTNQHHISTEPYPKDAVSATLSAPSAKAPTQQHPWCQGRLQQELETQIMSRANFPHHTLLIHNKGSLNKKN
jgi:hypothetical protein